MTAAFSIHPFETLAEVSVVDRLAPAERYTRQSPQRVHIGHDAAREFLPYFEKLQGALPEQKLYLTPDVLVMGKGTMLIGSSIAKENLEGAPVAKLLTELTAKPPAPVRTLNEPILYTSRYGVKNYGHCLTDILPRVIHVWRSHPELKIALHPEFVATAIEAMHGLGLPHSQIVTLDELPTRLINGHFASPCNAHPLTHSPTALSLLRSDLPRLLLQGRPATKVERMFVTRADASTRHLGNHGAVAEKLRDAGYAEISVGSLSHADQAATFHQAHEIVALAGAAMANIVYCRPGTRITLLSPSTMSALYFWDLASLLGLDFRIGYFEPSHPARGIHSDFKAPPDDVVRLCSD